MVAAAVQPQRRALGGSPAALVRAWLLAAAAGGLAAASRTGQPPGDAAAAASPAPHLDFPSASGSSAPLALPAPATIDGDVVLRTEADLDDALARARRALEQTAAPPGQSNRSTDPVDFNPPPAVIINGALSIEGSELADHHLERFLPMVAEVRGPVVVSDTEQVRHLDSLSQLTKVRVRDTRCGSLCCLPQREPRGAARRRLAPR